MKTQLIELHTGGREGVFNLTAQCEQFARQASGGGDGLLHVFVPHATAGLALMETGSGSESDLLDALERLLPRDDRYRHAHGSPGHGGDHLLPALVSPSVTLPVIGGRIPPGAYDRSPTDEPGPNIWPARTIVLRMPLSLSSSWRPSEKRSRPALVAW